MPSTTPAGRLTGEHRPRAAARLRLPTAVAAAALLAAPMTAAVPGVAAADLARSDTELQAPTTTPDEGQRSYIVTLDPGTPTDTLPSDYSPAPLAGAAHNGAVVSLTPAEAAALSSEDGVAAVEPDRRVAAFSTGKQPITRAQQDGSPAPAASASAPPWGLDRADQRHLPLDGRYTPSSDGAGVHIYVLDSGIDLDHPEFAGRIGDGAHVYGDTAQDCNGHGTHVAGTIASTRHGMAPAATLHPVKVLDCNGYGSDSTLIAGMNWIADHAPAHSIVNISIGGKRSPAVDAAAKALTDRGLVVAAAAGNQAADATGYSPAGEPAVLTVGAADRDDHDTPFSNYGPALDLYAPGQDIASTTLDATYATSRSGTSMAAPHVVGAAAVYWSLHPNDTGHAVARAVLTNATSGTLAFPYGDGGSPNLTLHAHWNTTGADTAAPAPPKPAPPAPANTTAQADKTPPTAAAPRRPGKPRVKKQTRTRLVITWRAARGPNVGYTIRTRADNGRGWTERHTTTRTRWTTDPRTLGPGRKARIRVLAANPTGNGPASKTTTIRINPR